jgi:hypothetical protein
LIVGDQSVLDQLRAISVQVPVNLEGYHMFSEALLANAGIDFDQALEFANAAGGGLAAEPDVSTQLMAGPMVERVDQQPERQIQIPQQALSD